MPMRRSSATQRAIPGTLLACAMAMTGVAYGSESQPAPKCSPPIRVDLSLDLSVQVDGGGPANAGTSGQLLFTVKHMGPKNRSARFAIHHVPVPVAGVTEPSLLLTQITSSDCALFTHFEPPGSPFRPAGYYYNFWGPSLVAGETARCLARFSASDDAAVPMALQFSVVPRECHTDTDWSNNVDGFLFGGPVPALVPVLDMRDASGLLALALGLGGILGLAGWRLRR